MKPMQILHAGLLSLCLSASMAFAQQLPQRNADQAVNSPDVRERSSLAPGDNLLFNGWGVTPAGEHLRITGDLPLKMIVSPDGKYLVSVSGGYTAEGITITSIADRHVTQSLKLPKTFNGLAFTNDGTHLLVSGGEGTG